MTFKTEMIRQRPSRHDSDRVPTEVNSRTPPHSQVHEQFLPHPLPSQTNWPVPKIMDLHRRTGEAGALRLDNRHNFNNYNRRRFNNNNCLNNDFPNKTLPVHNLLSRISHRSPLTRALTINFGSTSKLANSSSTSMAASGLPQTRPQARFTSTTRTSAHDGSQAKPHPTRRKSAVQRTRSRTPPLSSRNAAR